MARDMAEDRAQTQGAPQGDVEGLEEQERGFARIAALVEGAGEVAICAHTSPDGDALGSGLALALAVRERWPEKQVVNLLADDAPVPRIYRFLPGSDGFVRASEYDRVPDLFVVVDLSALSRLNNARPICEAAPHVAIIDHHPCEEPFGDAYVIRPEAAAAGVIVTEFVRFLGVEVTPDMAQCLFCAISTDTGRFQYQNADAEAFRVASGLVEAGANPSLVSLNVYQSFRLQYLHLESLVLGRIVTFEKGRIAYSYATASDFERTGADLDESDGLIDDVRSVAGSEVALFLKEVPGGRVRGNLRSKGELDVAQVAQRVGGGGHKAAAGFTIEGDVDEAFSTVMPMLTELVEGAASEGEAE